jgi:hypothetical protein
MGFRFEGRCPRPKLEVVAPHTSNWDFIVGIFDALALGFRVRFLGKDGLFGPPFGWLMRWLGGIPVNRQAPDGVIEAARSFREESQFLALAPRDLSPRGTMEDCFGGRRGRGSRVAGGPRLSRQCLPPGLRTSSDLEAVRSGVSRRDGAATENYGS